MDLEDITFDVLAKFGLKCRILNYRIKLSYGEMSQHIFLCSDDPLMGNEMRQEGLKPLFPTRFFLFEADPHITATGNPPFGLSPSLFTPLATLSLVHLPKTFLLFVVITSHF